MKYKKIRPLVDPWSSSYQRNRGIETRLSRLRIGHTYITHKYILQGDEPPICDICSTPLTVEHILVKCDKYTEKRRLHRIPNEIEKALNEDADVDNIMAFLKDIEIFYDI